MQEKNYFIGVGRRKTAVARVFIKKGQNTITINELDFDNYFPKHITKDRILSPLYLVEEQFDIKVNVRGGGTNAQAEAMKLGISRAMLSFNNELRPLLRENKLLTVDARKVERKKCGHRKARKQQAFKKR
jgi:small subunit ribosomal protein S9